MNRDWRSSLKSSRTIRMVLPCAAVLACLFAACDATEIAAPFLDIWPDARSTALAGATVSLVDDANSLPENPAALCLARSGALLTSGPWIPGYIPGMFFARASATVTPAGPRLRLSPRWNFDFRNLYLGTTDVIDTHGYYVGRRPAFRTSLRASLGLQVSDWLAVGAGAKVAASYSDPEFYVEAPSLGLDGSGNGLGAAIDLGALARIGLPFDFVSTGLMLSNLGSFVPLHPGSPVRAMPTAVRLGLCAAPAEDRFLTARYVGEVNYPLVGSSGSVWLKMRRSLGVEWTIAGILSLRTGYFEDLAGDRGGEIWSSPKGSVRLGLVDILTGGVPVGSTLTSTGACLGLGLGYRNLVRADFSTDAAIYGFQGADWKVSLTANDVPALLRMVRQGIPLPWADTVSVRKYSASGVLRGLLLPGAGMLYAEDYVASVAYFLVTEALAGLAVYAGSRASSMTQGQVLVPLTLLTGVRILELSRTASAVARYNQRHGF